MASQSCSITAGITPPPSWPEHSHHMMPSRLTRHSFSPQARRIDLYVVSYYYFSAVLAAALSGIPARAAPAIPASLCISAATTFVCAVRWGKNFSDFLLMPPPMMMRSGQSRNSTLWRYSSRRLAYSFQLRSSRLRALSAARCSASVPLTSMCPNSVLGTSLPPTKREVPMPVPSVSIRTTPSSSLPAPQRISARPAASASFTTLTEASISLLSAARRSKPIAALSMFAAVCTTPSFTTAGNPQPTGPFHPASRTTSIAVPTIASGVAGLGVLILTLSSSSSPDCVSTGAPLIPDPPTSIPNTFMLPPQTDTAVILYDPIRGPYRLEENLLVWENGRLRPLGKANLTLWLRWKDQSSDSQRG